VPSLVAVDAVPVLDSVAIVVVDPVVVPPELVDEPVSPCVVAALLPHPTSNAAEIDPTRSQCMRGG